MDFLHLYVEIKFVFSNFQKVLSEVCPVSVYFTPSANSEVGFRFFLAGVSQSAILSHRALFTCHLLNARSLSTHQLRICMWYQNVGHYFRIRVLCSAT